MKRILLAARALIEQGWCRGMPAKDARGYPCDPRDDQAVAWCLTGALRASSSSEHGLHEAMVLVWKQIAADWDEDELFFLSLWNDSWDRRKHEVLGVLDRAIGAQGAGPGSPP